MLRNVIILSVLTLTAVSFLTMDDGSSLSKMVGWATKPEKPILIANATPVEARQNALAGRQIALEANSNGHFQGHFRINGNGVEAMVDTGATVVAMNQSTAIRAGIRLSPGDFTQQVQTANGRVKAAPATISTLEVGRIVVHDVEAVVLEDQALQGVLIGMSFLRRLKQYEAKDNRLLLTQ